MKIENPYVRGMIIIVLMAYIVSPWDFMPLVEIDDGFAGILIGWILE